MWFFVALERSKRSLIVKDIMSISQRTRPNRVWSASGRRSKSLDVLPLPLAALASRPWPCRCGLLNVSANATDATRRCNVAQASFPDSLLLTLSPRKSREFCKLRQRWRSGFLKSRSFGDSVAKSIFRFSAR